MADHAVELQHAGGVQPALGRGDRLVGQAERVAHAALGQARQHLDGVVGDVDLFGRGDRPQPVDQFLQREQTEIEALTARQDGPRDLHRLGGGEDEVHVLGRFLERLEKGVERTLRQHVHLVDDEHALLARGGLVLRVLAELADVVDTGVAGSVDLEHVEKIALSDAHTTRARSAGLGRGPLVAVQRLRQQAGHGGLATTARAGEQVGMGHATARDGIGERGGDVLLPHHLLEGLRPPLPGQDLIRHGLRGMSPRLRVRERGIGGSRARRTTARGRICVRLLPSSPDRVGKLPLRRAWPRLVRRSPSGGNPANRAIDGNV